MADIIRVTPEKLNSSAEEFQSIEKQIKSLTDQMLQLCNELSSYYEGEDATAYVTKFKNLETDMNQMDARVKKDIASLQTISKNFTVAINTNVSTAQSLKSNIYQ